jgi:PadR family transcriptional regulator PadR
VASRRTAGEAARRVFTVTPRGARALAASRAMRERLWQGVDLAALLPRGAG